MLSLIVASPNLQAELWFQECLFFLAFALPDSLTVYCTRQRPTVCGLGWWAEGEEAALAELACAALTLFQRAESHPPGLLYWAFLVFAPPRLLNSISIKIFKIVPNAFSGK